MFCLSTQARTVAAATQTLCDAANAAVQGNASEERLIAGANQVASSTAQLLLACRVKADANSATQKRLQVCWSAVIYLSLCNKTVTMNNSWRKNSFKCLI